MATSCLSRDGQLLPGGQTLSHLLLEGKGMDHIKLENSESLYRQLVELSPDAILITIDTIVIYVNPAGVKLLGATCLEELVGLNILDLVHPDFQEIVSERIRHLREGNAPALPLEEKYLRLDGTVIDVEATAAAFWVQGKLGGQIIVRDITKRKQAERSLAEQLHFLELLIDTIPSPVFYKDRNGVYLGCNQSLAEFLGIAKKAIIGKTVFEVYPQELAEKYYQMDQALFQHPGTQIYEAVAEGANKHIRDFITSKATFIDSSGQVAGLIGVLTDITERKQAEAEIIRQREELRGLAARFSEVEEAERQQLARELHDQVCQTLSSISILMETLKIKVTTESLDKQLERFGTVSELARQGNEIVREIMEGLRPTVIDYGLMRGLRWLGDRFSQQTGVTLEVRGDEFTRIDQKVELALFRIAQEALNNVKKHARASQVMLSMEEAQQSVRLIIEDNGTGFDTSTVAKPKDGNGWGLTSMTERARAAGGSCHIESQSGHGTRVVVEVPW